MMDLGVEDERRLRDLLDLPVGKRSEAKDEFVNTAWRMLLPFAPYVSRIARTYVRDHELEDVSRDVVIGAIVRLTDQYRCSGGVRAGDWQHHVEPFKRWFLRYCGKPFQKNNYGEITNVVRKIYEKSRHQSLDDEGASSLTDTQTPSPEQATIDNQTAANLDAALGKLDRTHGVMALATRLIFGIHAFRHLDADALISIGAGLALSPEQRGLLRTAAKALDFAEGQRKLSSKQIAGLTIYSDSTVRSLARSGAKFLAAAARGPRHMSSPDGSPRTEIPPSKRQFRRLCAQKRAKRLARRVLEVH
jgi:hypothetical protein